MRAGLAAAVALTLVAAFGCGGGSNDACGRTRPCGGDVLGSWTVTDGCEDASALVTAQIVNVIGGACGMTVHPVSAFHTGMLSFAPDMTFTGSVSIGGTVTAMLPASCLGGMTCTAIENYFLTQGLGTHDCTGTSSCTCAIDWGSWSVGGTGTYTVADTLLTLSPQAGPGVAKDYCATGAALHLMDVSGAGIADDVVLAR